MKTTSIYKLCLTAIVLSACGGDGDDDLVLVDVGEQILVSQVIEFSANINDKEWEGDLEESWVNWKKNQFLNFGVATTDLTQDFGFSINGDWVQRYALKNTTNNNNISYFQRPPDLSQRGEKIWVSETGNVRIIISTDSYIKGSFDFVGYLANTTQEELRVNGTFEIEERLVDPD